MRPLLDEETLGELETRLRISKAPILEHLQPGLSQTEQDVLTDELGIRLSDEAQSWWGWRNGTSLDAGDPSGALGGMNLLPLEIAVEETKFLSEASAVDGPELAFWKPNLLAVLKADQAWVACECNIDRGEPSGLWYIDWEVGIDEGEPRVRSMRELVEYWTSALDKHASNPDAVSNPWWRESPG